MTNRLSTPKNTIRKKAFDNGFSQTLPTEGNEAEEPSKEVRGTLMMRTSHGRRVHARNLDIIHTQQPSGLGSLERKQDMPELVMSKSPRRERRTLQTNASEERILKALNSKLAEAPPKNAFHFLRSSLDQNRLQEKNLATIDCSVGKADPSQQKLRPLALNDNGYVDFKQSLRKNQGNLNHRKH